MIILAVFFTWLVVGVVYYRQFLICADLVERGRIAAPAPSPILLNRATKQFLDFVLKGKFRSAKDREVVRAFSRLRVLLVVKFSVLLGAVLASLLLVPEY